MPTKSVNRVVRTQSVLAVCGSLLLSACAAKYAQVPPRLDLAPYGRVALVTFSADVEWATQKGAHIERFNLAQQPMAFAENAAVKAFLVRSGQDALPLTLVDGEVALAGRYPQRQELARWAGIQGVTTLPVRSACCGGDTCC